jgi:hypothetical protein
MLAHKVLLAPLALLVLPEQTASPEQLALKASRVMLALLVPKVSKAMSVYRAPKVLLVLQGQTACPERSVLKAPRAIPALLVRKVRLAMQLLLPTSASAPSLVAPRLMSP